MLKIIQNKNFKQADVKELENLEFEWLIDNFLVKQTLAMIYTDTGDGKNYFMLYSSKYLLDSNKINRVIYFDTDNSIKTLKERKNDKFLKTPNFYYFFQTILKNLLFKEI